MTDEEIAELHRKGDIVVNRNIKKAGWHLEGVAGEFNLDNDPPRYDPPFVYSTGLTIHGLPELIMIGFEESSVAGLINHIGRDMMDGKKFKLDIKYNGYSESNKPLKFIKISQSTKENYMCLTDRFYPDFVGWQLLWADKNHLFPDESGYDPAYLMMQLMLSEKR